MPAEVFLKTEDRTVLSYLAKPVLDQMIDQATQAASAPPPPPPPDPKLEAAKVKAGAEQVKAQADIQSTVLDSQAKQVEHQMTMQQKRLLLLGWLKSSSASGPRSTVG